MNRCCCVTFIYQDDVTMWLKMEDGCGRSIHNSVRDKIEFWASLLLLFHLFATPTSNSNTRKKKKEGKAKERKRFAPTTFLLLISDQSPVQNPRTIVRKTFVSNPLSFLLTAFVKASGEHPSQWPFGAVCWWNIATIHSMDEWMMDYDMCWRVCGLGGRRGVEWLSRRWTEQFQHVNVVHGWFMVHGICVIHVIQGTSTSASIMI